VGSVVYSYVLLAWAATESCTVTLPGFPPDAIGTTGSVDGHPGMLVPLLTEVGVSMVYAVVVLVLVKLIEVTFAAIVPPSQTSMSFLPGEGLANLERCLLDCKTRRGATSFWRIAGVFAYSSLITGWASGQQLTL